MAKKPPSKHINGRKYKTKTGTNVIKLAPPTVTDVQFCLTHAFRTLNKPDIIGYAIVAFDENGSAFFDIYDPDGIPRAALIEVVKNVLNRQIETIDISDFL